LVEKKKREKRKKRKENTQKQNKQGKRFNTQANVFSLSQVRLRYWIQKKDDQGK